MKIRALVQGCHPEPTTAVTTVAAALALAAGQGRGAVVTGAAFLSGQLSIGWSNDWIDADRDRRTGRTDKPVQRGDISAEGLRRAALCAAAACLPLSLAMGVPAGSAHLVAVAAGWAYNARLKATAWSWVPYALAFGLVPSIVTLGVDGAGWAPWWATLAAALLGVGGHLANALPDLEEDEATGVRGLPHRLGRRGSSALAAALLLGATSLLAAGPGRVDGLVATAMVVAVVVTAGGLVLGRRPGSDAPFRAVLVVAGVDVALLLARGAALT